MNELNNAKADSFERNLIKNPCGDEQYEYWCFLKPGFDSEQLENSADVEENCQVLEEDSCEYQGLFENFESLKKVIGKETIMEFYTKNSTVKTYDPEEIGWEVQEGDEHGSKVINDEITKKPLRKFATTFWPGQRFQVIDLYAEGINEDMLKILKPKIEISENYAARFDCGSKYRIWVALLNEKFEQVDSFKFDETIAQWNDSEWRKVSHVFENYPTDVRYIVYYNSGVDTQFWAGFYGIKITNSSVRLIKSTY